MEATDRLYMQDSYCFETDATILAVQGDLLAFDRTCFYPGGGGQPADEGTVLVTNGPTMAIVSARADADNIIWHACEPVPPAGLVGQRARLSVNKNRRLALMRYHTALHVLNTIVLRDYAGWITGVQIGTDYSRIDFKWENFSPALIPELVDKVNVVLSRNHTLKAYSLTEGEF